VAEIFGAVGVGVVAGGGFFVFDDEEFVRAVVEPDEGAVLLDVSEPAIVEGPFGGRGGHGGGAGGFVAAAVIFIAEVFDGEFSFGPAGFHDGVGDAMFAEGGDERAGVGSGCGTGVGLG
jgi:hypothetical protein